MKKLLFLFYFLPVLGFAQLPPVKPSQVGSGSVSDAGKPFLMDANGRGTLGDVNLYWKVGGNVITGHSIFGTNSAYDLIFRTSNTDRLRILANGNIGIGVANPQYNLHVKGNVGFDVADGYTNSYFFLNQNAAGDKSFVMQAGAGSSGWGGGLILRGHSGMVNGGGATIGLSIGSGGKFTVNNQGLGGGTDVFSVDNVGNIIANGITAKAISSGNETDSIITVSATGLLRKRRVIDVITNDALWKIGGNNVAGHSIFGTNSAYDLIFRTSNTDRLRIMANGNIGIGVANPQYNLHVKGNVGFDVADGYTNSYFFLNQNAAGDKSFVMQAGAGSSGWGGGLILRGHSGMVNGGGATIGLSTGSGGKFTVNNQGLGGGIDVFSVDNVGNIVANGLLTVPAVKVTTGAISGYIAKSDGGGNLSWVNPMSITTAAPSFASVTAQGAITNDKITFSGGTIVDGGSTNSAVLGSKIGLFGGYASPVAGRIMFGDASGWGLRFATGAPNAPNDLMSILDNGNVGIGISSPTQKLDINGAIRNNGDYIRPDGLGISMKLGNGVNNHYGTTVFYNVAGTIVRGGMTDTGDWSVNGTTSLANTLYLNNTLSSALWGNIDGVLVKNNTDNSVRYASKALFLLNGGSNNTAPVQFGTNDDYNAVIRQNNAQRVIVASNTTTISNGQYTEFSTTTSNQPTLKLTQGGKSSKIWIAATSTESDYFLNNITSVGDIVIDAANGTQSMTGLGYSRKDYHFETNGKQLANVTTVDANDSSFVTVLPTTRYLRVYKSSAITTTKLRVNLPTNPQNNARITILVQDDITSLDLKADNVGQSIISAIKRVTPVAGEVIEVWFDSETEGSSYGRWYCKKL